MEWMERSNLQDLKWARPVIWQLHLLILEWDKLLSHVLISTGNAWKNRTSWIPRPCRKECKAIFKFLLHETLLVFLETMGVTVINEFIYLLRWGSKVLQQCPVITQHSELCDVRIIALCHSTSRENLAAEERRGHRDSQEGEYVTVQLYGEYSCVCWKKIMKPWKFNPNNDYMNVDFLEFVVLSL